MGTPPKIDPLFDGHLERPLSKMTPREKIYALWLQMLFRWQIRNRRIVQPRDPENSDEKDKSNTP